MGKEEEAAKLQVPQAIQEEGNPDGAKKTQKELVEELKIQWKLLWTERFNDKTRAEDISVNTYQSLRVEQGTVIHATRDFKALNFKEILEQHLVENPERFVQPDIQAGGWNKFVKTKIATAPKSRRPEPDAPKKRETQQSKKGGRGWLHAT